MAEQNKCKKKQSGRKSEAAKIGANRYTRARRAFKRLAWISRKLRKGRPADGLNRDRADTIKRIQDNGDMVDLRKLRSMGIS